MLEYVEGETLHGPMSFDEALPIIRQLIDGIEAAHEKSIIHREIFFLGGDDRIMWRVQDELRRRIP